MIVAKHSRQEAIAAATSGGRAGLRVRRQTGKPARQPEERHAQTDREQPGLGCPRATMRAMRPRPGSAAMTNTPDNPEEAWRTKSRARAPAITPGPSKSFAQRVRIGGEWEGTGLILIHDIGGRSGPERITPVGCFNLGYGRFARAGQSVWHTARPPAWRRSLPVRCVPAAATPPAAAGRGRSGSRPRTRARGWR